MAILLLALFPLSVAIGMAIFIRRLGPDAWLIRGLKDDSMAAVVVMCLLIVGAISLVFALRCSLSFIPTSSAAAVGTTEFGPSQAIAAAENSQAGSVLPIVRWLLLLCIPIVSGYLLSVLYRPVDWMARRRLV